MFGVASAADSRRVEFDFANESLLINGVRPDALFIGDSITHLWELQAYFGGTGKIIINRGIGGDITSHMLQRFEADALQLTPRVIVMLIGTNDMGWSFFDLNEGKVDTVCENIRSMVSKSQSNGIPTAVCSMLPVFTAFFYPSDEFAERKNVMIASANTRIKAIADELGAIYVDYHSKMVDENGQLMRGLADDGVHPHSAGYAIMAKVLEDTLAGHGISLR